MKPPAVVLGAGVNGLGLIRSLAKKQVPIYAFYDRNDEIGRYSKYVRPVKSTNVVNEPQQLLEQLLALGSEINRKTFLIPSSDAHCYFISENRKILNESFLFNIPEINLLDKLLEKSGNRELATDCGVLIPRTVDLKNEEDLKVVMNEFKFPIIIKPLNTFSTPFPGNKKNIVITSNNELMPLVGENENLFGNCVIQELIIGGDGNIFLCSLYFSRNSEPWGVYTGKKIRQYLPDYGITTCGFSIHDPHVEQISIDFMQKIGYKGLGTLEYALDISTGKYYFLELNPRSFYHNILFTDCNVNLSYMAYCDALGIKIPEIHPQQKEGIIWVDFQRDLASFLLKHKQNKIQVREWLQSVIHAKSYAVFDKHDLKPFLYATYSFISYVLKKLWALLFNKTIVRTFTRIKKI